MLHVDLAAFGSAISRFRLVLFRASGGRMGSQSHAGGVGSALFSPSVPLPPSLACILYYSYSSFWGHCCPFERIRRRSDSQYILSRVLRPIGGASRPNRKDPTYLMESNKNPHPKMEGFSQTAAEETSFRLSTYFTLLVHSRNCLPLRRRRMAD